MESSRAEYQRNWRAANPEKVREQNLRANHTEGRKASQRTYRMRHKEAIAERTRTIYAAMIHAAHDRNAASIRASRRKYFLSHEFAERQRARDITSRRRALARGLSADKGIDYAAIVASAKGCCGICRAPIGSAKTHFDHIIPIAKGGPHSQDNLQLAHATCNFRKNGKVAA